jgi:Mrp family chromosome partitioning ATPase
MLERVEEWQDLIAGTRRILVAPASAATNDRPLAGVAIARALAATEARVIAIDLHGDNAASAAMGESPDLPGFCELIDDTASYKQVIFRDHHSAVHFMPNGQRSVSSADLSDDERLETILEALSLTYDYVVVEAEDDALAGLARYFPVAMVATDSGEMTPRTAAAIVRISTASDASIHLLLAQSAESDASDVRDDPASSRTIDVPVAEAA